MFGVPFADFLTDSNLNDHLSNNTTGQISGRLGTSHTRDHSFDSSTDANYLPLDDAEPSSPQGLRHAKLIRLGRDGLDELGSRA